jgi:hypothetical protein
MLNLIDKNLLIAVLEKAIDYVHLRAGIMTLDDVETALVALRAAYNADPDAVTADQIEAVLVLMENAKFPSLKYISWAFPFWASASAPAESLLSWLSAHLLWDLIANKPSVYPPDEHTHSEYLESVAWSDVTSKPSVYPPDEHTHSEYLESVAWSDVTSKPSVYPPDEHTHSEYLESVAWSIITGKPATYPPSTHYHHSLYLSPMYCGYTGDGTNDREISLQGKKGLLWYVIFLMGYLDTTNYILGFWSPNMAEGNLWTVSNSGFAILGGKWNKSFDQIGESAFLYFVPKAELNVTGWAYRILILGEKGNF